MNTFGSRPSVVSKGPADGRTGRRVATVLLVLWLLAALAASGCASKNLVQVEDQSEFQKQVLAADRPVLVNFYKGGGCPTCLLVNPILNELAEEYQGRVSFARFEAMTPLFQVTSQPLRDAYNIAFFPTTVLFVDGKEKERWIMDYDINHYRRTLDAVLAAAPHGGPGGAGGPGRRAGRRPRAAVGCDRP